MADNTTLNLGVGGDTIRQVDKAGAKSQVILLDVGGLGVESLFTGAVTGPLTDAQLRAVPVPVSGTVATGALTDAQLRASAVPISAANLDVALSTRLKPADTLTGVTALANITGSMVPGTAATNLGKAEDAGHTTGDTGVMDLGVRIDVPNLPTTSPSSANTDYTAKAVDGYGVLWVRKRQLVTYSASYRLADATAGQTSLTFTFTANTNKQLGTIYHTAASTKTLKLRKILMNVSTGAAGVFEFELRALSATTAPATGNPAITPRAHDPADVAGGTDATCLALPTTAGSLVGADTGTVSETFTWNSAIAAAGGSPSGLAGQDIVLYEYKDGMEMKPLTMRAATAEGFAVNGRCTTAVALRFTLYFLFTEE